MPVGVPFVFELPHFQQAMLDTFCTGKAQDGCEIPAETLPSSPPLQLISLFHFCLQFSQQETKKINKSSSVTTRALKADLPSVCSTRLTDICRPANQSPSEVFPKARVCVQAVDHQLTDFPARSGWMGSEHVMKLYVSLFIAREWD